MQSNDLGILSRLPVGTLLAVLATLALGAVSLFSDKLNFDDYTTQVVVLWGFLAVGRGLTGSVLNQEGEPNALIRAINAFPWATVVIGIVAIVGYVAVLVNPDVMTWQQLGIKIAVVIGALGVGRGVQVARKNSDLARLMTVNNADAPFDPGTTVAAADARYAQGGQIKPPTQGA